MKKGNKGFVRFVALCLLAAMLASFVACGSDSGETESTGAEKCTYTVCVSAGSGLPLSGIGIYVYTDETMTELVWFDKTGDDGCVRFTDALSDDYIAVLSGVPDGYPTESFYHLTGQRTDIVLAAVLEEVEDLSAVTYGLGDQMNDFSITAVDGTVYTLSQLLEEKEAVVLNFWYLECAPCKAEFPYLQEAYEKYSDRIEVLAINPYNTDPGEVADFRNENGYTFPMMIGDPLWADAMQLTAYPTTVVIDRYGTITLIHKGSIQEEGVFESIFDYFSQEDYQQSVVEDVAELPEVAEEEEKGTASDPIEMSATPSFSVAVEAGGEIYLNIYKVSSYYVSIQHPDAYVIYKGVTYYASNGAVGLSISSDDVANAVSLVIGNAGTEDQTFTVYMSTPKGSYSNPYTLELGEFSCTVAAGNDQGVYYKYTATEDGVLTVKCLSATSGVSYDLILYNLSTYAYRNLLSEVKKDDDGHYYVSVKVYAGNTVLFSAGSLADSSGSYPRVDFKLEAFMGEPAEEEEETVETQTYGITVTDADRNPIPGVLIYLDVDGETKNVTTNDAGLAAATLPLGTYTATVKVPSGYEARTTVFTLTEKNPTISVKMDAVVSETADYTVHVVDNSGNPVPFALVSIADTYGFTDENGTVSFTLLRGSYTVTVFADGYELASASFVGNAVTMTVTLTPVGDSEEDTVDPDEPEEEVTQPSDPEEGATQPNEPEEEVTQPDDPEEETTKPQDPEKETTQPDDSEEETTKPQDPEEETTQPDDPEEETTEPEEEPVQTVTYTVRVEDYFGNAMTNVIVTFRNGDKIMGMRPVGSTGETSITLEKGTYTVSLAFGSGAYWYDPDDVTLTAKNPSLTIQVAPKISGEYITKQDYELFYIYEGANYAALQSSVMNYFVFEPSRSGVYKFTIVDSDAILSYWSTTSYIFDATASVDYANNSFTLNVKDSAVEGNIAYVIGATGDSGCVILVSRIGDQVLGVEDYEWSTDWQTGTTPFTPYTVSASGTLTYFDLNQTYTLVYNSRDKSYHLNSTSGPRVYLRLDYDALYISFQLMLETTGLKKYFYDEDGNFLKKEEYTDYMIACVTYMDETYGLYPLTKDLAYILQQYGDYVGWYDSASSSYLFGDITVNPDTAWLFTCCYFK